METPVTIATDSERNKAIYAYLTPTIGADGTAAIAVQHIASGEKGSGRNELLYRIDVAVYRPGNGWLEPTRLTPVSISGEYTALTLDGHGDITAAYAKRFSEGASSESTDDRTTVVVRRLSAGSTLWGPEEDVTGSNITHSAFALHLGEDEAGDAVLAYQYGDYVAKEFAVWGVTRQGANGSWTSSTQLVTGASAPVDAGVAPNGKAYVLYSFQGNSSNEDCEGVLRGATGGSFTVPRCVSPANEDTFNGSLAFLGNDAYFAWRGNVPGESSNATVQAARWPDSSSLPEIARNLDSPGASYGQPTLVNDNEGSIVAFYTNKTNELRVAAYDAGPPIPWNGRVPTIVEVGRPLNVSGTYVDLWSALAGPTTWEFGDGTPAVAGNAVSHVFTAAGSYPVTATAADKLGNTTSHTYNITVYAPGDTAAPSVTLEAPRCRKRMSKKACKQWLASRRAWQTLTGTVVDPAPSSGIANVQVAVYRSSGRRVEGLSGKRFRKTTKAKARKTFSSARLSGGRWSLKLPKLKAGLYTILVRASDRVGYISPTVSKAIRLR